MEHATYTCEYLDGLYTGAHDLCDFTINNGDKTSTGTFDPTTGRYTFMTNDKQTFPLGEYNFKIRITIEDSHYDISFILQILDSCPVVMPQIINQPFPDGHYTYLIGETRSLLEYVLSDIGSIQPSTLCGEPAIQFVTTSGSETIPDIFEADYANQRLIIGPTDDSSVAGDLYLRFKYYNTMNVARFAVSPIIKISIVDACNPPYNYEPKV